VVEASKVINSTLELEPLLALILDTATKNLNADRGTIYLVDSERRELYSKVLQGEKMVEIRLPMGVGIAGHVAETGETINLGDAYDDPRFYRDVDLSSGYRTKSMLSMPLWNKERKVIGVFQILNKRGGSFTREDEKLLEALSVHAALAIENAKLYGEALEKKRLEDEMAVAREIQLRLLPQRPPTLPGYRWASTYRPSRLVSGDYYDFFNQIPNRLGFAIGDVSGKGIPAALLMASLRAGLHAQRESRGGVRELVAKLNRLLCQCTEPSKFVTFFYGELHQAEGRVEYVNCGHNPPLHVGCNGELGLLHEGGMLLGMLEEIPLDMGVAQIASGDCLVLFTDGVTEALDRRQRPYGEHRLQKLVVEHRRRSAEELLRTILEDIDAFTGGIPQSDDITIVVMKRE